MRVTSVSLIQREIKSLKPVLGYFLGKKTKSGFTATFLSRRNIHTFSSLSAPSEHEQRPHSEIPTRRILYNFAPFIWPHKPVTFIFPLLIFHTLIQVSTFLKLYLKFLRLESLYGGQFTLSTRLIKQNYLVILSTDAAPQFL